MIHNPLHNMGYLSCTSESAVSAPTPLSQSFSSHKKPIKVQHFHYADLEAATNGFADCMLLGKGSHGSVYKAVLHGRPVAIKKPSPSSSTIPQGPQITNGLENEIHILSQIQNPGLVNLVGFTKDSRKDKLLVVEFMSNGTVFDVLHSYDAKPPNWGRRIKLALQTAKAIDTLHSSSPPVIHRDIKSANVLIDRNFNARLGDFGLALRCHVDDYRLRSTPPAGTLGYLDPCYVTPENLSTKNDVFSFGILLLEIISGRKAIDVTHSPPSIVDWAIPLIKRGKIVNVYDPRIPPPKDLVVRKQLAVIAARCVRSCKERRPSMKEIVAWLSGLCKLVPLHSWNGFNNPCMMVVSVGNPVEARNAQFSCRQEGANLIENGNFDGLDARLSKSAMRCPRRVYSDLGFGSNLMDLMETIKEPEFLRDADGVEQSSKSVGKVSSTRFGSGRYLIRGRNLYRVCGTDKAAFFGLSKGQIVAGNSSVCSKQEANSRSNLNSLADEII